MTSQKLEPYTADEVNKKLDTIIKRLDTLESIILEDPKYAELAAFLRLMKAGVGLYTDPLKMVADSQPSQNALRGRSGPKIHAKLSLGATEVNVGEEVNLVMDLVNEGRAPALLVKVERIVPPGFDLVTKHEHYYVQEENLELNGKRLNPLAKEKIRIVMKSFDKGSYCIKPKIIFKDEAGNQMSSKPEPVEIKVSRTLLPGRINTGHPDLDSLLFGGIPEKYAVILTSPPSDERDLLIERFLWKGANNRQTTFHITIDPSSIKGLAREFQPNFHLFVCNPQADTRIDPLPNVYRLRGVENLTDISIAFNKALRRLDEDEVPRRACIEIISDVLLQHKAVQTRKWLNDLITELKSRDFTILATMNPQMHSPREVHAILGLFEGEITIDEKQLKEHSSRVLKITRMHNQKYLGSALPLRKKKLQT